MNVLDDARIQKQVDDKSTKDYIKELNQMGYTLEEIKTTIEADKRKPSNWDAFQIAAFDECQRKRTSQARIQKRIRSMGYTCPWYRVGIYCKVFILKYPGLRNKFRYGDVLQKVNYGPRKARTPVTNVPVPPRFVSGTEPFTAPITFVSASEPVKSNDNGVLLGMLVVTSLLFLATIVVFLLKQ